MSTKARGKGQRRLIITPEAIEAWLKDGDSNWAGISLPEDARLLSIWPPETGDSRGEVTLLFESAAWEPIAEDEYIPQFIPDDAEEVDVGAE